MPQPEPKIALLIDADNVSASKINAILSEVARYGVASIRRAYGNWSKEGLKSWANCLPAYAICPVQQFDYIKGKNATDLALTIDAMDLLHTQPIDAFAIVSSDSDFTPLVVRMLTNNKKVYGFGERKAPSPFVSACSNFFYLETIEDVAKTKDGKGKASKLLNQDKKLIQLLRSAIANTQEADGWASMAQVGMEIRKQSGFSLKKYGCASMSRLFEAIDLFEICRKPQGMYVRQTKK